MVRMCVCLRCLAGVVSPRRGLIYQRLLLRGHDVPPLLKSSFMLGVVLTGCKWGGDG